MTLKRKYSTTHLEFRTLIILLIFGLFIQIIQTDSSQFDDLDFPIKIENSGLILIDGNEAIASYATKGDGTISNPFIIENQTIHANGSGSPIYMRNTNVYLIIRYNSLFSSGTDTNSAGISIESCSNILITQNFVSNNLARGIYLITGCSNINISQNIVESNKKPGIDVRSGSNYINVWNNNATNNSVGIYYSNNCNYNTILNNTISESVSDGICLYNVGNIQMWNNNIINSGRNGIYFYGTYESVCLNNTISNSVSDSITFGYSGNNNISNNTIINGQENGIYASNTHDNTYLNNYVGNNKNGFKIAFSSYNNIIKNNVITNNSENGIYITDTTATSNTISFNNITDNEGRGVYLAYTQYNTIFLNIIQNNQLGEARSEQYTNNWSKNGFGNYWGDYTSRYSTASMNKCFWNISYSIPGVIGEYDSFPIARCPDIDSYSLELEPDQNPNMNGTIVIHWNDIAWACYYEIYRSSILISDLNNLDPLTTTIENQYIDSSLTNGNYNYRIKTVNPGCNFLISNWESILVSIPAPSAPDLHEITINPSNNGIIYLHWSVVEMATSYRVYQALSNITTLSSSILITTTTQTSYNDTILENGTYYYAIIAVGAGQDSPISNCRQVIVTLTNYPINWLPNITAIEDQSWIFGSMDHYLNWTILDNSTQGVPTYSIWRNETCVQIGTWVSNVSIIYSLENLTEAYYQFELQVDDGFGMNSSDVVFINVTANILPTVSVTCDKSWISGTTGHVLNWTVSDSSSNSSSAYSIWRNGTCVEFGTWNSNVSILYSVDNLTVGSYLFEICVNDGIDNTNSSDSVQIVVTPNYSDKFCIGF